MKQNLPTMSSILRKWLLLGTLTVFVLTRLVMFFLQYRTEIRDIDRLLTITLRDVSHDIQRAADEDLIVTARQIAETYDSNGNRNLDELAELYEVSEINVINSSGIVVESTVPQLPGFDMYSHERSAEFMKLMEKTEELVQPLRHVAHDEKTLRKYAGIRLNKGGIMQVGCSEKQFQTNLGDNIWGITGNRHVMETGMVYILDAELELVTQRTDLPGERLRRIFSEGDRLGGPKELTLITDGGKSEYWMYDILEGYRIVAIVPQEEALATVRDSAVRLAVSSVVLIIIIYLSISYVVKVFVLCPVDEVDEALAAITGGNLDRRLNIQTSREFARISDGINKTVDALKGYIAREAARIDEELAYASRIQTSALPLLTAAFTDDPAFRLYAFMETAREVGGDFYDFYKTDKGTVAFLIADVSGKGIPAAMFMMTGKTVLRDCVERTDDIGSAMAYANKRLCEGNEADMFVTAWIGLLDLNTGLVRFANAGHNPPVLIRDGQARFLEMQSDLILAIMDDAEYSSQTLQLEPHDLLLLYTDGVTEAANEAKEFYGEKRLLEALSGIVPEEDNICELVCGRVKASVDAFAAGAPQADDITMLCLHYRGQNT